jgi:hypothetical protein
MKKLNFFATALIMAFASAGVAAQQITDQSVHSPAAGGARVLEKQGNTPANPAIGFHDTPSTVGSPQNDVGGGNGIFRPAANEMGFATSSQQRMHIGSSGQIGIGTVATGAALHLLTGTTMGMLPPVFKFDRNDGTNQAGLLSIGISGNGFASALLGGGSAYFKLEDPYGNSANRDMGFSTNGLAAQFVIKNNGFIGIGTEAPTAKLHSIGTARLESLPTSTTNNMVISTDANGNLSYQSASSLFPSSTSWLLGGNAATTIADYIGTSDANPFIIGTSATERARFTDTGQMGIGLTAPTAQLDVTSVPSSVQTGIKALGINTGIYGEATDMNAPLTAQGTISGHTEAIGVFGKGSYISNLANGNIFGVVGSATEKNPLNNVGVFGEAKSANGYNTGVYGQANASNGDTPGIYNTGVAGQVYLNNTSVWNRAIFGTAPVAPKHYAGYFDGHVSMMLGNVGINTLANRHKLNVHDGALLLSGNVADFGGPQLLFSDDTTTHPNGKWAIEYLKPIAGTGTGTRPSMGGLNFWTPSNPSGAIGAAGNYSLFLKNDGKVGMGVTDDFDDPKYKSNAFPNGYRLYVNGGILTDKVQVAIYGSTAWADYVFEKDYKLKPLSEVEAFIKANKHLPNIQSADELAKTGLDLAAMQAKQMEKIEELTLYMIEMKKEIDSLKKENQSLKGAKN